MNLAEKRMNWSFFGIMAAYLITQHLRTTGKTFLINLCLIVA